MSKESLDRMANLPFVSKIEATKCRIREWYDLWDSNVFVSFSGGKDSSVLLQIARECYPEIEAVFLNTGLEYPEIVSFVKSKQNVTIIKPKYTFNQIIRKYGYPVISKEQSQFIYQARNTNSEKLRNKRIHGSGAKKSGKISEKWKFLLNAPFEISNLCCDFLKKNPSKKFEKQSGKKPIVGNMAQESRLRSQHFAKHGCNAYNLTRPISNPIAFWSEQDVLRYIYENSIEISSVYGELYIDNNQFNLTGVKRTGCMFCMYGVHKESCPNRFQMMSKSHPKIYDYCINTLGIGSVLDYIGVPYK